MSNTRQTIIQGPLALQNWLQDLAKKSPAEARVDDALFEFGESRAYIKADFCKQPYQFFYNSFTGHAVTQTIANVFARFLLNKPFQPFASLSPEEKQDNDWLFKKSKQFFDFYSLKQAEKVQASIAGPPAREANLPSFLQSKGLLDARQEIAEAIKSNAWRHLEQLKTGIASSPLKTARGPGLFSASKKPASSVTPSAPTATTPRPK